MIENKDILAYKAEPKKKLMQEINKVDIEAEMTKIRDKSEILALIVVGGVVASCTTTAVILLSRFVK